MKVAEVKIAPESEHGKLENRPWMCWKTQEKGEKSKEVNTHREKIGTFAQKLLYIF